MTRHIVAAHERVTLPETPLEESDEYDALTSGDARRRIPTVRPRDATAGRTTAAQAVRGSRTTAQQTGEPRNWQ
ncbi:hypothetical protein [Natrinema altunense]|uniref:Uncharacterized protein n=1 Tax=Natrinema altunense (strain JCM 12890 / CGMCC 1.3731 / AJ2) TaxID=1227494 RepID=L9ZTU2_NATA2|nr:hypothetical protein [Natrinema altunense]ELY88972.1 hypothetical protein C485_05321 [Natrinema altunense JCM 12890]